MLTTNQILQQGRYRIVNQLGQNGIGVGYEAFDTTLGASVLLKEIRDNSSKVATAAQIESRKAVFAGKAKPLTEMKHQSLLLVKDYFSEIDHHYLVTELTDGNTLGELLEKKKSPFPLADVSDWADSLLDALNYLHTLNPQVIHGEIKPQNVRLLPNGKVKLHIFNLINADEKINSAVVNQTFDAAVLPYLPLEQIWDGLDAASRKVILTDYNEKSEKILEQPADPRSDVYALAATLYHLLTARIPADALTRSIDILEGQADPLLPPSQINPSVPTEVSDVLVKALEIKRENRYSSAVIMRQVLRTAFVRVKEREANGVKTDAKPVKVEEDAVLEIPVVAQKPAEPKPAPAEVKNREIETEQLRQLELIKQQLREAESRRQEAEQRAAHAEKRLLEAEKQHVSVEPAAPEAPVQESAQNSPAETYSPAIHQSDDFSGMFAEPEKEGGAFKKVAAAAVALIVLGGAGFGIWSVAKPKTDAAITTNNASLPAPTASATPAPSVDPNSQTTADANVQPTDGQSTETNPTAANPAAAKVKPTATPTPQTAQAKKPTATPDKKAEQKKVTLDDLLKDN
jgi:serine/threonine protein kinase